MLRIEDLETTVKVLTELEPEFVYRGNNRSHAAYGHVIRQVNETIEKARELDDNTCMG